jgi:hypothetical protein
LQRWREHLDPLLEVTVLPSSSRCRVARMIATPPLSFTLLNNEGNYSHACR